MYRGSNTEEGKFYHRNIFEPDSAFQRLDSDRRVCSILNNYDPGNASVLDLGCNIGFFSFGMAKFGGNVTGIDYDTEAIKFAKKMVKDHDVKNTKFLNKEINVKELEKLGKQDCVLALAVLSWIMHQTSREEMEKVIDWISKNSEVSFIEIQYRGEPGQLEWITNDDECEAYLKQWFKYVYKVIKVNGWGPRTVWKCGNSPGEWKEIYKNVKNKCALSRNGFFRKVKENKEVSYDNEVKYLTRLKDEMQFPKVLEQTDDTLLLSGFNAVNLEDLIHKKHSVPDPASLGKTMFNLVGTLEDHNIMHQDINFENLLVSNFGTLFLVDFECATDLDGDVNNPVIKDLSKLNNTVMGKRVMDEVVRAIEFFRADDKTSTD